MRLLIAPQEFKGSLSAAEAAQAMRAGAQAAGPDVAVDAVPLPDGGPGFLDAMLDAAGGVRCETRAHDPLGREIRAAFGLIDAGKTAVIESAEAAGLKRLSPDELDVRGATTAGVGDLIRAALDRGATRLLVGIGGSATNDGGAGMASALGARLLDAEGRELPPGGAALRRLARIDTSGVDPRLARVEVVVASDVTNPLLGPTGASAIFGPQKGADPTAVAALDAALGVFAEALARDLGQEVANRPGAGAAGGLGAGLLAFLGASIRPGFAVVAEAVHLRERIRAAVLVLTGEGSLDVQTGFGKTVAGVAALAAAAGVPAVALAGRLAPGWRPLLGTGLTAAFAIADGPLPAAEAQSRAAELLAAATEQAVRLFLAGAVAARSHPGGTGSVGRPGGLSRPTPVPAPPGQR